MRIRKNTSFAITLILAGMTVLSMIGCSSGKETTISPGSNPADTEIAEVPSDSELANAPAAGDLADKTTIAIQHPSYPSGEGTASDDASSATDHSGTPAEAEFGGTSDEGMDGTESISLKKEDIRDSYTPKELQTLSTRYNYYLSDETVFTLNGYGMNVSDPQDVSFHEILDVTTGEVAYYSAQILECTRQDYGYYSCTRAFSRLYSAEGQLLIDWTEAVYSSAVGSWVAAHSYYDILDGYDDESVTGYMIQVNTGKLVDGIFYITEMSREYAAIKDSHYSMIGVVDQNGEIITDLSTRPAEAKENPYFSSYKNYITLSNTDSGENKLWIYTPQMQLLGFAYYETDDSLYSPNYLGPYICVDGTIYDPTNGHGGEFTPLFQANDILYYDGEIALCTYDPSWETSNYYLVDAVSGNALAGPFNCIGVPTTDGYTVPETKAEYIYACDDDTIYKLDRSGKVIASCPSQGTANMRIYESSIVCTASDWSDSRLMDMDLKDKIPYGRYDDIYRINYSSDFGKDNLWYGRYLLSTTNFRICILSDQGEVLMDGVSDVSAGSDGYIGISRGFYYGIIDKNGNWVTKIRKSDFTNSD